jgi:hypothetical protein
MSRDIRSFKTIIAMLFSFSLPFQHNQSLQQRTSFSFPSNLFPEKLPIHNVGFYGRMAILLALSNLLVIILPLNPSIADKTFGIIKISRFGKLSPVSTLPIFQN